VTDLSHLQPRAGLALPFDRRQVPHSLRAGERVLLVDDDGVARLLTASALAARGWQVIEAEGGAQALALFERERPEVVVLDALMPDLDGFATCEQLRRRAGGEHVPVLMLTGLDDEQSIAHAYEAGATDFFVKSTSQWTLLSQRLRYLLRAARMREELVESQATLSKAQRIAGLGSWEWDIARGTVRLSGECLRLGGLPPAPDGLPDRFVWDLVHEDDRPLLVRAWQTALTGDGAIDLDCRIRRADGELRVLHVDADLDRDPAAAPISLHGVVQDITARKLAEDQIRQLANFDSLTGLPNRRYFRSRFSASLERARESGSRVALLFIDIDRFKQINDTLGHQRGDELLVQVARRLQQVLRASDLVLRAAGADADPARADGPTVARLGGDEFTVLITDLADAGAAAGIADRVREALARPVQCGSQEVFVSASIGVALYPEHGADVDTLVRKADIAMYAVKDGGRNGWALYRDDMSDLAADRWAIENDLHRAVERGELVLHYQPKVDVAAGRIVGAEALMRWRRGGELVPPVRFIGAAEDSGLIVPLTEWAIAEVCRQLARWRAELGAAVPVSVNISGSHVQRGNIAEPVAASLQSAQVPAALLELELTETVLMQALERARPQLQALKQLGVSVSIDDFGTGYSSLAYLRRLPIDTLKIDCSFVRDLEQSDDAAAIVAAIIAMGHSLKLRVVAEGVETVGQKQWLAEHGCTLMQGWLFARALPQDQFGQLLAQQFERDRAGLPAAGVAAGTGATSVAGQGR